MRRGASLFIAILSLFLCQLPPATAFDDGGSVHTRGSAGSGASREDGRTERGGGIRGEHPRGGGAGHVNGEHRHGHAGHAELHRYENVIILGPGYPDYYPGYSEHLPPAYYPPQPDPNDHSYYCQFPTATEEYQKLCTNGPQAVPPPPPGY